MPPSSKLLMTKLQSAAEFYWGYGWCMPLTKYQTRVIDIGYLRPYTLYASARPHTMVLVFLLGTTTQGRLCLDLIHISRAPLHTQE